jgi:hypothetical protein
MGPGLRFLVGLACFVVVAFGVYYFAGEYRAYERRALNAEQNEIARKEIFRLANAEDGEDALVRGFCAQLIANRELSDSGTGRRVAINCRYLGYAN